MKMNRKFVGILACIVLGVGLFSFLGGVQVGRSEFAGVGDSIPKGNEIFFPFSYLIDTNTTHFFLGNGTTWKWDVISTNASLIFQTVLTLEENSFIFVKNGEYTLNGGLYFPGNSSETITIQGESRGGVSIYLNAPDRILSYSGYSGKYMASSYWCTITFKDLTLRVKGDYSATAVTPVNMTGNKVLLENVWLLDWAKIKTPAQVFRFGGVGAPGVVGEWKMVYLYDNTTDLVGTSGFGTVLKIQYEGFHWIGGGWGIFSSISTSTNRLNILSLSSGASQPAVLEDLDGYIAPGVTASRRSFAEVEYFEAINVEFPDPKILYPSTGAMLKAASSSYVYAIIRAGSHGNEGNWYNYTSWNLADPGVTGGTSTFIYYEGVLRNQTKTPTVGTSGVYGATSYMDVLYANNFRLQITTANVIGETISVQMNMTYLDGKEKTLVKTFATNSTYELTITDLFSLAWTYNPKLLELQVKTTKASTTATAQIDVITG